jgi:hypothetical protein
MFAFRLLAIFALCAMLAWGAGLEGTWSATSPRGSLAGSWTKEDQQGAGVTGTWTLLDASGRILLQGGWSASKSAQSWKGAWRATVSGSGGEFAGTWASSATASPQANMIEMFKAALQTLVSGTWKAGSLSGAWSIRTTP